MPSLESELLHRTKFRQCTESNSLSPLDKNWAVADEKTDAQLSSEMWPIDRCSSSECESEAADGGRLVHGDDAMANFTLDGDQVGCDMVVCCCIRFQTLFTCHYCAHSLLSVIGCLLLAVCV